MCKCFQQHPEFLFTILGLIVLAGLAYGVDAYLSFKKKKDNDRRER